MSRVLVIDDNDDVRSTLKLMLESGGHDVAVAFDGFDGLAQFRSRSFDLVFSDVQMPHMDGFQAMRELRRINAELPIIMMSGLFELADRAESEGEPADRLNTATGLGATRTIGKPFRRADLLAAVCACLAPAGAAV